MAGPLNYPQSPHGAAQTERTARMWVFDGEEWTLDDGGLGPAAVKPEARRPRYDEMMPELQVIEIEIVRQPQPDRQIPPLPIP